MKPTPTTLAAALERFAPQALPALLSQLARLCPACGSMMTIRTSKRTASGDRLARLRCRACGATAKRKL